MDSAQTLTPPTMGRNWRRTAAFVALTIAAIMLAVVIGVRVYLTSSHARSFAADKLTTAIGLPVEVESLSVGSSSTELKVRSPVFQIGSVVANVSLIDLLAGRQPTDVVLKDVVVDLPLAANGDVKTELAKASTSTTDVIPNVRVENATLIVRQDGREPFRLERIRGSARSTDGRMTVDGECDDPSWGRWTLKGSYQNGRGTLEVSNPDAVAEMALLKTLPVVPSAVWQHVTVSGRSPADIHVEFGKAIHYAVTLKPTGGATIALPQLEVPFGQVAGTIRIADEVVTIEKTRSTLADGTVTAEGRLDFQSPVSKLAIAVDAAGLDVKKLPAEWSLPPQLSGKLRGHADLDLTIGTDGMVQPRGGGEAVIDDAKIAGLPAEVKLRLRGDGRRYRFESQQMSMETNPDGTVPIVFQPAPPAKPEATTLDANVTLRDVDVAELLKQVEVTVPYKLAGKVTVNLVLAVPVGTAADRSTYRFRGTLTSSEFFFEGLKVTDVAAEIRYRDGVLTLTELKAKFPSTVTGTLNGTAKVQVEPRGDLTANLILRDIPVGEITKAIPNTAIDLSGAISGNADLRIPLNTLKDYASWSGKAELSARKLTTKHGTIEDLKAKANLDRGVAKLSELHATLFQGTLDGTASVPLSVTQPGKADVTLKDVDAAVITKSIPDFPVPLTGRISGTLAATLTEAKDGKTRTVDATVSVQSPKLTIRGIPADKLTGSLTVVKNVAAYSLEGHTLGGTFEIKGRYPAAPQDNEHGHLQLRNLDLSRVGPAFQLPAFTPLSGRVNLSLLFDADGTAGMGNISITDLAWNRESLGRDFSGTLMLTNGVLDVRDFSGRLAGGRLRIRARYDFDDPRRNFYSLTLDRASLKVLSTLIPMESREGELSIVARGKLGAGAGSSITITLGGLTLGGVAVSPIVLPLEWSGGFDRGRIVARDAGGRFGNGTLTANVTLDYGIASRLSGDIKFQNVQLRTLLGSGTFGNGRISGRVDLGGENIRSFDDITATLNATLNQTSVKEVPLVSVVTPFLQPLGFLQPFDAGEVKGRLAKGIFRLERFALSNPGANVFAEGTVTRRGRIDLDVIAVTGQVGPNVRFLQLVGVTAIGPLPLTTIQRVSDLLSNRMVRLSVTGTVAAPTVQVNKAALLTDTAVRFFLGQYVIPESIATPK